MQDSQLSQFTQPTDAIDSTHPSVVDFARLYSGNASSDLEKAVAVYYAVRDEVRYDPYQIILTVPALRASATLEAKRGWCVSKAVLLAASCRALGIPARLGFADVRNHLSTERLRERMGGIDIFYWHGYADIFLDGKWVKATPAFNIELCTKFRLLPLEFDGRSDSIYHPFDAEGNRHMEYVAHRGVYSDLPLSEIISTFQKEYPGPKSGTGFVNADFGHDVETETSSART
ncbi:MAG TPA: transglutaminase-like domain-containing protein [Blastocatellia bacterium]